MNDLDIIWNISLVCPWDCEFCCTDAVHVRQTRRGIVLREDSLSNEILISANSAIDWPEELSAFGLRPNYLDHALRDRQRRGRELFLSEKMAVLNHINVERASIDFAGGDPLACAENILVIAAAAKKFGRGNVSITSTGHSISRYPFDLISSAIGTFEFTYDEPKSQPAKCRPTGYNESNLAVAKRFSSAGILTKCQIPLHFGNSSNASISQLVGDLAQAEISEILLMRVFPVGRGGRFTNNGSSLSKDQILRSIDMFRQESSRIGGPSVRLQCALKHLYTDGVAENNPCDMMQNSFGINYQGLLLTSAWATNEQGMPLSSDFVLGSLVRDGFDRIALSDKFSNLSSRLNENWGHCKIFAYANSADRRGDSMFSRRDPLFSEKIVLIEH